MFQQLENFQKKERSHLPNPASFYDVRHGVPFLLKKEYIMDRNHGTPQTWVPEKPKPVPIPDDMTI